MNVRQRTQFEHIAGSILCSPLPRRLHRLVIVLVVVAYLILGSPIPLFAQNQTVVFLRGLCDASDPRCADIATNTTGFCHTIMEVQLESSQMKFLSLGYASSFLDEKLRLAATRRGVWAPKVFWRTHLSSLIAARSLIRGWQFGPSAATGVYDCEGGH